jgi:hypothetical protein
LSKILIHIKIMARIQTLLQKLQEENALLK